MYFSPLWIAILAILVVTVLKIVFERGIIEGEKSQKILHQTLRRESTLLELASTEKLIIDIITNPASDDRYVRGVLDSLMIIRNQYQTALEEIEVHT